MFSHYLGYTQYLARFLKSNIGLSYKDFYLNLGMNNDNEFKNYLSKFDIEISFIKEKLNIEANWNQLIFEKFKNQISINNDKIKKKLQQDIKNKKYANLEFDLSEIVYGI